jgi:hypothetical protein
MRFPELLIQAIQSSEIPLRFEPGAEESVALPVTELLRAWLLSHVPGQPRADFEFGQKAVLSRLLEELSGDIEVPQ